MPLAKIFISIRSFMICGGRSPSWAARSLMMMGGLMWMIFSLGHAGLFLGGLLRVGGFGGQGGFLGLGVMGSL